MSNYIFQRKGASIGNNKGADQTVLALLLFICMQQNQVFSPLGPSEDELYCKFNAYNQTPNLITANNIRQHYHGK